MTHKAAKLGFMLTAAMVAVTGFMMLPANASALSCARPDVVSTLERVKESPKLYHILVGRFVSPKRVKTPGGYTGPKNQFKSQPPTITPSYFEGVSLAKRPHNDSQLSRFPVDIETSCIGPWCSSPPQSDYELIAFVEERSGQSPILRISPCPSLTFQAKAETVQKVRQCLDQTCEPDKPNGAFRR